VQKLSEAIAALQSPLASLAGCLQPVQDSPRQPVDCDESLIQYTPSKEPIGAWNGAEQELLAKLEQERLFLLKREAELQEPSVETADLEQVVQSLRRRVAELEARETRVGQLREECSSLRAHIAGLVASTLDHKALEAERSQLLAQATQLQDRVAAGSLTRDYHTTQ
jgi:hypothetical protein